MTPPAKEGDGFVGAKDGPNNIGVGYLVLYGRIGEDVDEVSVLARVNGKNAHWVYLSPEWPVPHEEAVEVNGRRGPRNWHAVWN